MSPFQAMLLAIFGALGVAGVLIFALFVGSSGVRSLGPVTIWGTLGETEFKFVLQQVADQDAGFAQVTYVEQREESYANTLTEALASGRGPDIFIVRQDFAVHEEGKVFPIPYSSFSPDEFRGTFIEAANPFLGETGVIAIPTIADPLVLYWNRDLLGSAGFATAPKFWDEFPGIAQKVTKKSENGQILKSAVSFGEYRNVSHAKEILSILTLQAGGTITERDSTGELRATLIPTAGGKSQAVESALRFYTEFADPSKAIYSWSRALPNSQVAFAAGDAALYVGFASEKSSIIAINPNLNFALAPLPQIRGSDRTMTFAQVYGLAVARTSKIPTSAVTVASRLASLEESKALAAAFGLSSARRDALAIPATGEIDIVNKQTIIGRAWADPNPEETDEIFRGMIENVTTGATRLSDAIARAHEELAHVLRLLNE